MYILSMVYEPTPNGDTLVDIVAPKNGTYILLDTNVYVRGWDGHQPKPYLVSKLLHSVACSLSQWTGQQWTWREYCLPLHVAECA